jgi:hypothetical protein
MRRSRGCCRSRRMSASHRSLRWRPPRRRPSHGRQVAIACGGLGSSAAPPCSFSPGRCGHARTGGGTRRLEARNVAERRGATSAAALARGRRVCGGGGPATIARQGSGEEAAGNTGGPVAPPGCRPGVDRSARSSEPISPQRRGAAWRPPPDWIEDARAQPCSGTTTIRWPARRRRQGVPPICLELETRWKRGDLRTFALLNLRGCVLGDELRRTAPPGRSARGRGDIDVVHARNERSGGVVPGGLAGPPAARTAGDRRVQQGRMRAARPDGGDARAGPSERWSAQVGKSSRSRPGCRWSV